MRMPGDVLYNFHWVVPGELARSAHPYAGFFGPFLRRRNIRAVVNLRGRNPHFWWWRYETRVCERLGMPHEDIAINSRNLPDHGILLQLIAIFDALPKPILVKCSGGQDRASLAAALYLIHRKGWGALGEAGAQFARWPYLHLPKPQQLWMKAFLGYASERAEGAPITQWLATGYSWEDFRAWLAANGLRDSFRYSPGDLEIMTRRAG